MTAYQVTGGRRLTGEIPVQGAKNSVLPILAAALLVRGENEIANCPALLDTRASLAILNHIGAKTSFADGVVTVQGGAAQTSHIPDRLMKAMRSSALFAGPLLGLTGRCTFTCPGGCDIGSRPLDLHLFAFEKLGAVCEVQGDRVQLAADGLKGGVIHFPRQSVGATENAILAALAAEGKTTLIGCAREPEIVDLQAFIRNAGGTICGAGTSVIEIQGKTPLRAAGFTVMPDRICTDTYLLCAAATGGDVFVRGGDIRNSLLLKDILERAGCHVLQKTDGVHIKAPSRLRGVGNVRSAPYPGFATDSGPCLVAALAGAEGATLFVEGVFDSRFRYVKELMKMGADLKLLDRACLILGRERLAGREMYALDLRGGAALVTAALAAEGVSTIRNAHYIQRGYEDIRMLRCLGAEIKEIGETGNEKKEP